MPSAIAHAAPALALIPAFYRRHTPRRLWVLGVLCAAAPDLDVLAFSLGVPYEHPLGHRGLWHSVPFAALASWVATILAFPKARPRFSRFRAWLYLFLPTSSHGLLDAFTNGGLGVALLSPFDSERYFSPFRPIQVSPLSVRAFLSARGASILANELVWVWLPFSLLAAAFVAWRSRRREAAAERSIGADRHRGLRAPPAAGRSSVVPSEAAPEMIRLLRHLLAIAILPFTVTVLVPVWIAQRYAVAPVLGPSIGQGALQVLGGALLTVGLLLFLASLRRFATEGQGTLAPWDPPRALVVRGPYRWVRNPMISGVIFVLFGEALVFLSLPHGVWAAAFLVLNLVYIPLVEEPQLERRFGEAYREYRRNVRRFLPRLRPWGPGATPRAGAA